MADKKIVYTDEKGNHWTLVAGVCGGSFRLWGESEMEAGWLRKVEVR